MLHVFHLHFVLVLDLDLVVNLADSDLEHLHFVDEVEHLVFLFVLLWLLDVAQEV